MGKELSDYASALLDAAKRAGADQADALVVDGRAVSIEVRAGALEHAENAEGIEGGLRVIVNDRQASISASDMRAETFAEMAERAVAMAKEAPVDPYCHLADASQLATERGSDALELFDPTERPSPDALKDTALEAEAACLAVDGVTQAQGAGATMSDRRVFLAASNGFAGGYSKSAFSTSCVAIAGEGLGMERDGSGESRSHLSDLRNATEIGTEAGERAISMLGAKRPPTGAFPILFDERVSSTLIGHMLAAVNGTSIVRGSSWLMGALGEQVLPRGFDVTEDPTRVRMSGSKPFDAEGLATAPRAIVKDGVLQSWTMDLSSARQLGLESTASAARGVSGPPSPTVGNIALTQGSKSKEELMAEMGTGLLITSMIGSTINPNTGDYSRGASGFWVENGEITGPVNECTVAGNLRDMLKTIVAANDARTYLSRVVPSLLVEGMTLAGG